MRNGCWRTCLIVGIAWLAMPMAASLAGAQSAAGVDPFDARLSLQVPQAKLQWYKNPDGSCVQCSIGMCGLDQNVPQASTLLWDSEYGPAERGGSYPSRVTRYADKRGMRIYNVTGTPTWDWMTWACANGRGAAIGAGSNHFQTLVGHDLASRTWFVVNNNGDQHVQPYDDGAFRRLHLASGQWCVILDYPPAPVMPHIAAWWD